MNETMAGNLRAAADVIDQNAHLPAPYITTGANGVVELNWFLHGRQVDERATAAAIVKAIDGEWTRGEANYDPNLATWTQERDGMQLYISVQRDAMCERIVTGTTTVTVPAVEAQPERTEVVETVEWRCQPLLGDATERVA